MLQESRNIRSFTGDFSNQTIKHNDQKQVIQGTFSKCQTCETIQEFFESLEKIAKWNSKLSSVLLAYVSPYEHFKR